MLLFNDYAEILIECLLDKLKKAENELSDEKEETYLIYKFLSERDVLLIEWINYVYKENPAMAKKIVSAYHDETLDLSTLECSRADFEPWKA